MFGSTKDKNNIDKAYTGDVDIYVAMKDVKKVANSFGIKLSIVYALLFGIVLSLYVAEVFNTNVILGISLSSVALLINVIAIIIGNIKSIEQTVVTTFLLFTLIVSSVIACIVLKYGGWLYWSIPIIFSAHYYNTKITAMISIMTEVVLVAFLIAVLVAKNSFFGYKTGDMVMGVVNNIIVIAIVTIICIQGTRHGKQMVVDEAKILAAKAKAEKEASDYRTQIMVSQIQPHFIYNTLNSIYYLCDKQPETAKKAIADFSDYLRMNLNFMDKKEYISFDREIEHVKKYLSLEKMRFEDELNVEYDLQETSFKVPALSVQPMVENAVKHGICKKEGGGTIKIKSYDALSHYEIIIEDNGVGFDVTRPYTDDKRHVGLENTRTRFEDMCKATLKIESKIGVGTKVVIKLPKENYYEDTSR